MLLAIGLGISRSDVRADDLGRRIAEQPLRRAENDWMTP